MSEEICGHHGADGVGSDIVWACIAEAIAIEPGQGLNTADF